MPVTSQVIPVRLDQLSDRHARRRLRTMYRWARRAGSSEAAARTYVLLALLACQAEADAGYRGGAEAEHRFHEHCASCLP